MTTKPNKPCFCSLLRHPPPEVSKADNSLRFTDILFGFVIKEVFIRLANWPDLPMYVFLQLLTVSALVLGSWIGYRRSLNRSVYEVKFFNLPLIRFLVDQVMLILYFRLAVLTTLDPQKPQLSESIVIYQTLLGLLIVFGLYFAWDVLGLIMATVKIKSKFRYPKIDGSPAAMTTEQAPHEWPGFWITVVLGLAFGLVFWLYGDESTATTPLLVATGLLVIYRVAKEVRTSVKMTHPTEPAAAEPEPAKPSAPNGPPPSVTTAVP